MSGLEGFHEDVASWFESKFDRPTPAQQRGWPGIRAGGDVLIAAPTGSGKTFAAFLWAIDSLHRQAVAAGLADGTQVVYVSPLRALSNDIERNLEEPLEGIREAARGRGQEAPRVRAEVRTGDTPPARRQQMARKPPHILVTTPESLYILLTSESGRRSLRAVKTVIVDEIHALAGNKRGSHLSLTLERLDRLVAQSGGPRPQRVGLSATQSPIEGVARFLAGRGADGRPRPCIVVDEGHARDLDLAIEVPLSPVTAVMSGEVWEEVYDRMAELIEQHRTTLIFVATRRLSERLALNLGKRIGEAFVASHHGSIARDRRLRAEQKLKSGELKALVATASLELGIDIGYVDLVLQLGSPRRISSFLQRVGRSGHRLGATPKGRLFALSRDELVECAALVRAVRAGRLDTVQFPVAPLDILAQQVVAMAACEDLAEEELFTLVHHAEQFADLERERFDEVLEMLASGYVPRRGRPLAWIARDVAEGRIRGRKGARLVAVTCGGAIPEVADYDVVVEPSGTQVGTVNEDFAIESMAGDVFQLGNQSWRILRVESSKLRVEDARNATPTIPFWLGEGPSRSDELSEEVSRLRSDVESLLNGPTSDADPDPGSGRAFALLTTECGVPPAGAEQIVEYVSATRAALGRVPTQQHLVLERFFDEAGGMQLVLHAPFGQRVNRAWGLALRKKFCRTFNFELQAAANDDSIVLSLGPMHSFPLDEVFHYLPTSSVEHTLKQALLPAPMFGVRWRWNASRSLAVLRNRGGKKVPPPLQRMRSDDLLALIFPEATACPENLVGEPQIPDHVLVDQTIHDCLTEAMDLAGLIRVLGRIESKSIVLAARDTAEPSPMAHEILNSKPYTFLDDAPLEERRVRAVQVRRSLDFSPADDSGRLDADAIARVRADAWPRPQDADETHDALQWMGFVTEMEAAGWGSHLQQLHSQDRAFRISGQLPGPVEVAAERLEEFRALLPDIRPEQARPALVVQSTPPSRERALAELLRGRLDALGPITSRSLAAPLGVDAREAEQALVLLEADGSVLRGRFTPGVEETEWCERRLLARIHRATLDRLRKEIEPVSTQEFVRFLVVWQHLDPETRLDGPTGLLAIVEQMQGFSAPLRTWEEEIFRNRMLRYDPAWLDQLCLSGELVWLRYRRSESPDGPGFAARSTPIAFIFRDALDAWRGLSPAEEVHLDLQSTRILTALKENGASFLSELVRTSALLDTEVEEALRRLVAASLVTSDGVAGLRYLLAPEDEKRAATFILPGGRAPRLGRVRSSGRWATLPAASDVRPTIVRRLPVPLRAGKWNETRERDVEAVARQLLTRYGVVYRSILERESPLPPWRELLRVYRRLEARGEVRGGRFVDGAQGEQFALPLAVDQMRALRRRGAPGGVQAVSACDPLNLAGVILPGERVAAHAGNSLVLKDGAVAAVIEGGELRFASGSTLSDQEEARAALGPLARRLSSPDPQRSL